MKPTVYLAGPIAGCDKGEANDWRWHVAGKLRASGIVGISPLRCEPLVGERYMVGYEDPRFGTARAIASIQPQHGGPANKHQAEQSGQNSGGPQQGNQRDSLNAEDGGGTDVPGDESGR